MQIAHYPQPPQSSPQRHSLQSQPISAAAIAAPTHNSYATLDRTDSPIHTQNLIKKWAFVRPKSLH